ncbi:hypothetical protein [Polaromonas naphthalenivorans]|uniref:Uncharacterized protein n=1 Tax=Polaromonas naphthalenivorans (strain CJ2) TaxID=365044 RepID=A1VVK9_POLNA|nr:hypothetical protein [Polaromonas naphthalenivorans]ABM39687.1 hypothetical protein Pnap_4409 [Polaromonas naphthalenivorans CJ2]
MIEQLIQERADLALQHQFRVALASPATGKELTPEERHAFLTRAFREIARGMGIDRFAQTPVERMDQFAVLSVQKNHDTAGLLLSLMNSFMIAYGCPETCDRAYAALVQIEGLRAEVADAKGQGRMSNKPELVAAAQALDAELSIANKAPGAQAAPPYRVMIGADRLFVKSAHPLANLPARIHGFAVEAVYGPVN